MKSSSGPNPDKVIPFAKNIILTRPHEAFPMPVSYKGWSVYFGSSMEQVHVPSHLQAEVANELSKAFVAETFTQSREGFTEFGRVTVNDGDKKRTFEAAVRLIATGRDDEYNIESLLEV